MKKLVVLSGAGVSAESGLKTFRDAGGLWEGHRVEEVATPGAFLKNPALVNGFYNQRRIQLAEVEPNEAHVLLAELEKFYNVCVITQNIDNLHERGGSSNIIHLHGELIWACSSHNRMLRENIGYRNIKPGELASDGSLLRPDIVWFGEDVPKMEEAILECLTADIFLVIGTSLEVYPAAGLIHYVPNPASKFIIDPKRHHSMGLQQFHVISDTATRGMKEFYSILVANETD